MEKHLLICAKRAQTVVECPFARQGCTFQTSDKQELDDHNKVDMPNHLKVIKFIFTVNQFLFSVHFLIFSSFLDAIKSS